MIHQPSPELLNKDAPAMCNALENNDVDIRDIDAFVEDVDNADDVDAAFLEVEQDAVSFVR